MLVLSRKSGESIRIVTDGGDEVIVTVVRIVNEKARIGITAPRHISVVRGELEDREEVPREGI